jgi:Na+/proline symporter
MSATLILGIIVAYFTLLLGVSYYANRHTTAQTADQNYFLGNRQSAWYLVAFGMISDSLSGVTFISVPGAVGANKFGYLQVVLGYVLGYVIIAQVLLPLYYRLGLVSIYSYLSDGVRFGKYAQKTASFFFILSRLLGSGARLFLTATVIQLFLFDAWGIPFAVSVGIIIALILAYTYKGGIKTLVFTDALQSTFLLLGVVFSIAAIVGALDLNIFEITEKIQSSAYAQVFFWDWKAKSYFWKQLLGGAFICVAMTGLDQNMMQKNLSCRSLPDAQKNMYWFSAMVLVVNVFFVGLGALLYFYADAQGIAIPAKTDQLFPNLALNHLGIAAGLAFIVGLTAATFSSADSVLTTLTTSFYIDILHLDKTQNTTTPQRKKQIRQGVHIAFAVLLLVVILIFKALNSKAIIDTVLTLAGYTYGPLLGLFAFGICTRRSVAQGIMGNVTVPLVCLAAPVITYYIDAHAAEWLGGYVFGFELLMLNGLITFVGLMLCSRKKIAI